VNRVDALARVRQNLEMYPAFSLEQATAEAKLCLSCGLCSECMECVKACSAGAIVHDQQPAALEIEVGSIILTPGIEEAESDLAQKLGLGMYANVMSGLQFERILAAAGPSGRIRRPSDGADVRNIAFIQCVGGRDGKVDYCSSICCMNTAKAALGALERDAGGDMEVSIFCREIRPFGKDSNAYIHRAHEESRLQYIRAVPSRLEEAGQTGNLRIVCEGSEDSEKEFDLVVLSMGFRAAPGVKEMAARIGVHLDPFGFAQSDRLSPLTTSRPGVYVAGAFQEPKDISESVTQASGAAACAMGLLTAVRGTMTQRHEYPWERDVADEPARIGVFVCRCGHNIASVVDVESVARKAAQMPGVCHAEAITYSCSDSNQQHIRAVIRKHRLNRLVVASCSSRTHEVLFRETLRESGLNQYLFAMTNIRDQCSWVHRENPPAATAKAVDLVSMAVARAGRLKAFPLNQLEVTASALIIGGGLAGMTAALNIADQGFKVHLVEREAVLGGLLRKVHRDLERDNIQAELRYLTSRVLFHPDITVYRNATLVRTSGQVGNFNSAILVGGKERTVKHGVVIVATGGQERMTDEFLHGQNPHVVTQSELESALAGDRLPVGLQGKSNPSIVMIQCVESRNRENPYCGRVCCSEAIKNALEIKDRLPEAAVAILNRDIRTYGSRDDFFRQARDKGVRFIRYSGKPQVAGQGGRLDVEVHDADFGQDRRLDADLVVLSTGIAPAASNPELAGILRGALSTDGFFLEAHPKLRPIDLSNEGEFVCGLAHSPRFMDETIAQAQAAAGRASRILSKTQLEIVGQVSYVNPADCVACATCVKLCPYGAPMINALGKSEIQGAKCMGCGSCVAACPARAIALQHQESETVLAMLGGMRGMSGGLG
jgi:heterodisulfide reductase subunit A-like polyferredoxin